MKQQAVERLARRVARSVGAPRPVVIRDKSEIPTRQRRYHVGRYKFAGVVCAEFYEEVYVYWKPLHEAFGDDLDEAEKALRRTLTSVARGFGVA